MGAGIDGPVIIAGGARNIGLPLARRIAAAGSPVLIVGSTGDEDAVAKSLRRDGGNVTSATVAVDDRQGFAAACRSPFDAPAVVVHAHLDRAAGSPTRIVDVTPDAWAAWCDDAIVAALTTVQAVAPVVNPGGRVVFVVPTAALTGAAGLVAMCSAAEAQRVLAKSVARRWGIHRTTCNVITVARAAFFDESDSTYDGDREVEPALIDPALAPAPVLDDVLAMLRYLVSPGAAGLTGATLHADRGSVMAP
jgi:3-oxoacyl-[acyl-carrier protein] reductase